MVIDESIGTFPLNHNSLKAYCQLKSCYKMIKKLVLLFMNYNFRFFHVGLSLSYNFCIYTIF